jgi:hypothetical protein
MSTDVITSNTIPFVKPEAKPTPTASAPVADPVAPAAQTEVTSPEVPNHEAITEQPKAEVIPQPESEPTSAPTPESVAAMEALLEPYNKEFITTGDISEASLKELANKLGAPEYFVKYTFEGMKLERNRRDEAILSNAGGSDVYKEMVAWASSAYSADEAQAFNNALTKGTKEEALAAVARLKQRFTEVNGSPKATIAKATQHLPASSMVKPTAVAPANNQAIKPFGSFSELVEAQRDKRYGNELEYTASIIDRLRVSKF